MTRATRGSPEGGGERAGGERPLTVTIQTPAIDLGALLKLAGLVQTGGQAKILVQGGRVRVNGAREVRRGHRVLPGDTVALDSGETIIVKAAPA